MHQIEKFIKQGIMVKSLILNCRLTKYRSQNNRLSVRTSISQRSQRYSLINQRGRRISLSPDVFPCVSLPTLYADADRRYPGFDQHSHAHTFSLSLSLCYLALPSSIYKALRRRNLDQSKYTFLRIQFSHFKGSTYTKEWTTWQWAPFRLRPRLIK